MSFLSPLLRIKPSSSWLFAAALAVLCGIVLVKAVNTVAGLAWPYDPDLFRDVAQAQTIVDGSFGADPFYLGESVWYNPLTGIVVGLFAILLKLPAPIVDAQLGPYLNLLAPLSFYWLAYAFGRDHWKALAATVGYLFVISGNTAIWASATYSPWLFAPNFTQTFFFLALIAYRWARAYDELARYVPVGILLGLCFLGHTAPALVLGAVIALDTLIELVTPGSRGGWRQRLLRFGVVLAIGFLISLPLTLSILGRYHLHVVNNILTAFFYDLPPILNLGVWIALFGFAQLILQPSTSLEDRLLILVVLCASLFLLHSYAWEISFRRGDPDGYHTLLPIVVPGFHFNIYIQAMLALFFGRGLISLVTGIIYLFQWLSKRFRVRHLASPRAWSLVRSALLALAVLISLWFGLSTYDSRDYFQPARAEAMRITLEFGREKMSAWLRANTRPDDVILSTEDHALFIIGPSGRKVMVVYQAFSNVYVRFRPRLTQKDQMFIDLQPDGSVEEFFQLAEANHVTYVLVNTWTDVAANPPAFLQQEYSAGDLVIYRIVK